MTPELIVAVVTIHFAACLLVAALGVYVYLWGKVIEYFAS